MSEVSINEQYMFFTPMYDGEMSHVNNEILEKEVLDLRKSDVIGRSVSNRNGWQSQSLFYEFLYDSNYVELIKLLETSENIAKDIATLWRLPNRNEIYLDNAWCNINGFGGSNVPHVHAPCIFSMVYYVKSNESSPELVFMRPDLQEHYTAGKLAFNGTPNEYTGSVYKYKPVSGKFVFFPSWIQHYVEPNMSNEDRISIAINFSSN